MLSLNERVEANTPIYINNLLLTRVQSSSSLFALDCISTFSILEAFVGQYVLFPALY